MGQIRKIQRNKELSFSGRSNEKTVRMLKVAWNDGYDQGAKEQRESDVNNLVKILQDLETVPGFGEKTVVKIREHFMSRFGVE